MKLRRRAGETLMEVLTSMSLFAMLMAGFADFMGNQTVAIARTKDMEKIMYYAQKWATSGDYSIDHAAGGMILFSSADQVLTVTLKKNGHDTSMQFRLD